MAPYIGQQSLGITTGRGVATKWSLHPIRRSQLPLYERSKLYPGWRTDSYNSLELGYGNGGYGEYDMSGGSVGANGIYVGASVYRDYRR